MTIILVPTIIGCNKTNFPSLTTPTEPITTEFAKEEVIVEEHKFEIIEHTKENLLSLVKSRQKL
jgi:hypothetical protein